MGARCGRKAPHRRRRGHEESCRSNAINRAGVRELLVPLLTGLAIAATVAALLPLRPELASEQSAAPSGEYSEHIAKTYDYRFGAN